MTPLQGNVEYVDLTDDDDDERFVVLGSRVKVPRRVGYVHHGRRGSPSARLVFEIRDGSPTCIEVTVTAGVDGRGVKTGDLETLPSLDNLARNAFAELAVAQYAGDDPSDLIVVGQNGEVDQEATAAKVMESIAQKLQTQEAWKHKRKATAVRALDEGQRADELEAVARIYREHLNARPIEAVQSLMGYESTRTASRRVQEARRAGFLPPTTRGKARA